MKPSIPDNRCRNVRSAVRFALAASAISSLMIPYAQAAEDGELQEIIVTGSRIAQPNLEGISPITTVSAEDFKVEGASRVEDLLNRLPQVFAGQAATLSNAADGTATVDLRGLGPSRTLVLINGRRMMPGDPQSLASDINAIPAALIKRVEIMTGGASATYGADAVSGVVNFIMDDKFEGLRLDSQYSLYQHNNRSDITPPLLADRRDAGFDGFETPKSNVADGGTWDITASMGTNFADGAGHLTAYLGYRTIDAITQAKRDYSACTVQTTATTAIQCGGSATSYPGTVFFYDGGASSTTYSLAPGRGLEPGITHRYNFAPTNYFQRPDTRYTGGLFANYEVSDSVKPYLEMMFMDDRSLAQIAASGDFGNTLTINCDNPLLSPAQAALVCGSDNLVTGFLGSFPLVGATNTVNPGAAPINFIDPTTGDTYNKAFFQPLRRNVEGGPRIDDLQHISYKQTIGTTGDLGSAWSYDTYYQFGRVNFSETYSNEFSTSRLNRAMDVVTDQRAGSETFGEPVCRSVVEGTDPLCVPYDILSGGNISPEAVQYLSAQGFTRGTVDQRIFSAAVTGQLGQYGLQTPWSNHGLGVALGVEGHRDSVNFQTDQEFSTGDLTGQGAPTLPVKGSIRAKEVFTEVQLPLITQGVVEDLTLNSGYRYSKYDTSGDNNFETNTWKVGVEFAPIHEVRFRGGINRAVRAPNVVELFAPNFVALDGSNDPCANLEDANGDPRAIDASDVGCLAQGLHIGQSVAGNPAGQYNGKLGGNPNLKPEKATTKSVGVIVEPAFLPNFSLTLDYYDINVKNAIQGFGADAIVNTCTAQTAATTAKACALVHRNPVSGSLWLTSDGYIDDTDSNVGGVRTTGVDVNGLYSYNLGSIGKLSVDMVGTYITKYSVDNGISAPYDCAGYFGATCSSITSTPTAPTAKWRHNLRVSLEMPSGLGASMQWRYFGSVKVDLSSSDETLAGDFDSFNSKLNAQSYLDLSAWYKLAEKYTLRFGINNVLDDQPPVVSSGRSNGTRNPCPTGPCNGNTYPAVYDALGRYVFASVSISL